MTVKTIDAIRAATQFIQRIIEAQLPMAGSAGLRIAEKQC